MRKTELNKQFRLHCQNYASFLPSNYTARSMSGETSSESSPNGKPAAVDVQEGGAAMMQQRQISLKPRTLPSSRRDEEDAVCASDGTSSPSSVGEVVVPTKAPSSLTKAKDRKKKATRVKKPKDMPRRPLSAYNIFFREERERMLNEYKEKAKAARADADSVEPLPEPKIGFENMAKTIGKRWKALSEEGLARYKDLARADMERYRGERDNYQ